MSARPTPADRRRDLIAGAMLAAGAAVYAWGYLGLRRMATQPIVQVVGETAVQRTHGYEMITRVGMTLFAAGIMALVWAAWRHRAARKDAS